MICFWLGGRGGGHQIKIVSAWGGGGWHVEKNCMLGGWGGGHTVS